MKLLWKGEELEIVFPVQQNPIHREIKKDIQ